MLARLNAAAREKAELDEEFQDFREIEQGEDAQLKPIMQRAEDVYSRAREYNGMRPVDYQSTKDNAKALMREMDAGIQTFDYTDGLPIVMCTFGVKLLNTLSNDWDISDLVPGIIPEFTRLIANKAAAMKRKTTELQKEVKTLKTENDGLRQTVRTPAPLQ